MGLSDSLGKIWQLW